jgi:tetratricopeptide (TPR) repeat protein
MRQLMSSVVIAVLVITVPAAADELDTCYNYKDSRNAIEACTRLIKAGTYSAMANVYSARGVAHRWSGNPRMAIPDFDEAIRLNPKHSIAYGQRGIAHRDLGNRAQALADLQTAVALDDSNQTAVTELRLLKGQ